MPFFQLHLWLNFGTSDQQQAFLVTRELSCS